MALIIDPNDLQEDTLLAIIEAYVTAGADMYRGQLADDSERVRRSLLKGELIIQYSEEFDTVRIIPAKHV